MALLQTLRNLLFSPVPWTFAVKGANAIGSFAVTILLARISGAEIVGQYALAIATATLVGLVPLRGLDLIGLRTISGDLREKRQGEARGTARFLVNSVFWTSLPVMLLFAAAVLLGPLAERLEADSRALLAAALGVLAVPVYRLALNLIRSLGKPVWGQFFEALPSVVLAIILLVMALGQIVPPLWLIVLLMFGGQLGATALALMMFRRSVQVWPARIRPPPADIRAMKVAGLPLMGVTLLHQFSNWFLLAATTGFASAAETGAFRATMQIMMLVLVIFTTAETYVSPRIGGDLRTGKVKLAWRRHRRATALMLALSSPFLLLAALVPEWVMGTVFGAEFISAAPALRIMAIGQFLNVLTGPVGSLLVMAGHERVQFLLAAGSALAMVVLGVILIPLFGLEGAAAAYAGSLAIRNIGSYVLARMLVRPPATTTDAEPN